MIKRVEVHGQWIKLYSIDEGRTWSSSPQLIVAYGRRKQTARLDLQKTFERLGDIQDADPSPIVELGFRNHPGGH